MFVEHYSRLATQHRSEMARHLTALDRDSRALRFGMPACDEALARYVAGIDFERDIVEGVWDEGALVGVAHLAIYAELGRPVGDLGISVAPAVRHQHLGQRLLARVLVHARLLRLARIYVRFLTRNRPMALLAREFTSIVEVGRGDACATIEMEDAGWAAA